MSEYEPEKKQDDQTEGNTGNDAGAETSEQDAGGTPPEGDGK